MLRIFLFLSMVSKLSMIELSSIANTAKNKVSEFKIEEKEKDLDEMKNQDQTKNSDEPGNLS